MNPAQKAWLKRERVSNHTLLKRNQLKLEKALKRKERAEAKMLRATNYFVRSRNEVQAITRRVNDLEEAIGQGKLFPDVKEPKKKAGRRIEL